MSYEIITCRDGKPLVILHVVFASLWLDGDTISAKNDIRRG